MISRSVIVLILIKSYFSRDNQASDRPMLVRRIYAELRGLIGSTYFLRIQGIEGSVGVVTDCQGPYCVRSFNMSCVEA